MSCYRGAPVGAPTYEPEGIMDYGEIITRAWRITWNNKYLWVLGFLAALTSAGSNGNSANYSFNESDFADPNQMARIGAMALLVVCVLMIVGLLLWLLSVAARGGLVAGVNQLDDGEKVTLGEAFGAGWKAVWRVIGVYLLTYLPLILISIVVGIVVAISFGGAIAATTITESPEELFAGGFALLALCLCLFICALIPISIILYYIAEFGMRGVVIHKLGITESIRQGWQLFRNNLGPVLILAVLLFIISIMVSVALGIVMVPLAAIVFGPAFFSMVSEGTFSPLGIAWTIGGGLCLGIFGAALMSVYQTWVSAVWTLAYKAFTSKGPEFIPEAKLG